MYIKPDGAKLYGIENNSDVVRQYSMGVTDLYSTSTTWTNGTVNDELYTLQQALSYQLTAWTKRNWMLLQMPTILHWAIA